MTALLNVIVNIYKKCKAKYLQMQTIALSNKITRGPRGPWVAHLRKRSKVTVDQIIENPRGIIGTTLVEDL